MNRKVLLALSVIVGICTAVHAGGPAGIVLYFESDDEVYLLLADHKGRASQRGWGGFGGSASKGESPAETAARETDEETRGYFSRGDLLKIIKDQVPVVAKGGFAQYFARVAFVPAQRVSNNTIPEDESFFTERGPYAWMPYSEIEKHLLTPVKRKRRHPIDRRFLPAGSNTDWVWTKWLGSMRQAAEEGALPWAKK